MLRCNRFAFSAHSAKLGFGPRKEPPGPYRRGNSCVSAVPAAIGGPGLEPVSLALRVGVDWRIAGNATRNAVPRACDRGRSIVRDGVHGHADCFTGGCGGCAAASLHCQRPAGCSHVGLCRAYLGPWAWVEGGSLREIHAVVQLGERQLASNRFKFQRFVQFAS